jgi:cytochrome c oxidase assembly protein subunit 11
MTPGRTALALVGVAATMLSLSFASVPFYDWFCRVTGYGGATTTAEAAPGADHILDRTIRVRFDASTEPGMPWHFAPVVREMDIRIGETGLAFYEARNMSDRPVAGSAIFNVTPENAGGHFTKVTFFVDPAIVDDPDARSLREITLSYTFYETDLPEEAAAIPAPAGNVVN